MYVDPYFGRSIHTYIHKDVFTQGKNENEKLFSLLTFI